MCVLIVVRIVGMLKVFVDLVSSIMLLINVCLLIFVILKVIWGWKLIKIKVLFFGFNNFKLFIIKCFFFNCLLKVMYFLLIEVLLYFLI